MALCSLLVLSLVLEKAPVKVAPKAAAPAAQAAVMTPQAAVQLYKEGQAAQVVTGLEPVLAAGTLAGDDLSLARACLAVAYFSTGKKTDARKVMGALLTTNPDYDFGVLKPPAGFFKLLEKEKKERAAAAAPVVAAVEPVAPVVAVTPPVPTPVPIVAAPPAHAADPAQKPRTDSIIRLAVMDPKLEGGDASSQKAVNAYVQAVVAELNKLTRLQVISMADIREMLGFERQKQILGCGDDAESCLSELAGSVGADELLTSQVAFVGKTETVTLKRLSMRTGRAVQSDTRTLDKGDGSELMALVGLQVEAAFPDRELKVGKTRGVDKETLARLIPPPLPRWIFFSAAGGAVVAGGAGAFFGLQMKTNEADYNAMARDSVTDPKPAATLKQLERRTNDNAQLANGLFIGAGVLAAGALGVSFLTNWNSGEVKATAALVPAAGGGVLVLSGAF